MFCLCVCGVMLDMQECLPFCQLVFVPIVDNFKIESKHVYTVVNA